MELPQIVFMALAVVVIPILGIIIARIVLKCEPYEFDMVFMKPGVNDHVMIRGSSLDFKHEIDGTEYEIKSDRLYRVKPGFPVRIWMKIRSVRGRFTVVYPHKKTEPIAPTEISVTARILKEVKESRALDKALRGEFKVPMDMKKILLIIGFIVIVSVIYVLMSGEIAI